MVNQQDQQKLIEIIENVRTGLQMDGGDMEFVSYENGVVKLKFSGACVGCPMSLITFQEYIEKEIKTHIPEVKEVQISE